MSHRLACLLALLSGQCLANVVQIPLDMDQRFIESLLHEQIFTGPGHSVRINDDGTGCQHLELREPDIKIADGQITLRTKAEARAGRLVGNRCVLLLNWRGQLAFDQRPVVSGDGKSILLRTESWRALTPDGQPDTLSTTVGHWVEQFMPPGLRETRINLTEPLRQMKDFLALVIHEDDMERVEPVLESIVVDSVSANDNRVTVTLSVDAPPPAPLPATPAPAEPRLSAEEVAELETRLDAVDAFATYTVKRLGTSPGAAQNVDALFGVLLDLRHELITIASQPQRRAHDPARTLFVDTWNRLTPILHEFAQHQAGHGGALRFLTFIGAGDMLSALDHLGPGAGIEISTNGLRRLARILVPADPRDPLRRDDGVDAELRKSSGFGPPLPPPQIYDETSWLGWFIKAAVAADRLDPSMVKKLNTWVPKTKDVDEYLPLVRDVLRHAAREQLRDNPLDPAFHEIFRNLVFTAAWQESCWRQFMVEKDMRVPLQSGTGDIGMMQINLRVWRGFYDQHGLKWDIVYNARAGAEILEHYLSKYAIGNREHKTTGNADNLARSAYAAYNGGPRQYDRYRRNGVAEHGKQVDRLFYEKYSAVKGGKELAVKTCYGR